MRIYGFVWIFALFACQHLQPLTTKATQSPVLAQTQQKDPLSITSQNPLNDALNQDIEQLEESYAFQDEEICDQDIISEHLVKQQARGVLSLNEAPLWSKNPEAYESLDQARIILQGGAGPSQHRSIPYVRNSQVMFWIHYFKTNGRETFIKWLIGAESLKAVIADILNAEGIPSDMVYIAMIESGFSNTALSKAKASGLWQFMPNTARYYGLRIDQWVDERKDPIKSTIAATKYLRDLYKRFGHWHLALAAYNAGPGKIRRAVNKAGTKDFFQLVEKNQLGTETKHYIPKAIAALTLAENPKRHGFFINADPSDRLPTTHAKVKPSLSLSQIAAQLGISLNLLRYWNPELRTAMTPPAQNNDQNYRYPLRLPEVYVALLEKEPSHQILSYQQPKQEYWGHPLSSLINIVD